MERKPGLSVMFKVPEKYRITSGQFSSDSSYGNHGAFKIPVMVNKRSRKTRLFHAIASDSAGWEHVSVSLPDRCPVWEEMCIIKGIFWDEETPVMQLHPPRSDYVNTHKYCLHLWRPTNQQIPLPDSILVG